MFTRLARCAGNETISDECVQNETTAECMLLGASLPLTQLICDLGMFSCASLEDAAITVAFVGEIGLGATMGERIGAGINDGCFSEKRPGRGPRERILNHKSEAAAHDNEQEATTPGITMSPTNR